MYVYRDGEKEKQKEREREREKTTRQRYVNEHVDV